MKKVALLSIILLIFFSTYSQKLLDTFYSSYYEKTFKIELGYIERGSYLIKLETHCPDSIIEESGLLINVTEIDDFIENIQISKEKYIEWRNIAINKNVRNYTSRIVTNPFQTIGYFNFNNEWKFNKINPIFGFYVYEKEDKLYHLLAVGTQKFSDIVDDHIECEGSFLMFTSIEEIDDFLDIIKSKEIKEYFSKEEIDHLFDE